MPIIRRKLDPNTVYPTSIRYNPDTDTVESNVNGEWVENPLADPRHQTTFPPRFTGDTRCDAAQSVIDALSGQIDGILTAIDNGGTAFTIAGIILSLLSFGVFGVFISIALAIADAMLDAGSTALSAALTPAAYEQARCALYCQMDGSGRIDADGLVLAEAQITDMVGGLGAIVLNSMLSLAGEGGINNLASIGTSSGDCSECECGCLCDIINWHWDEDFLGGDSYPSFERDVDACTINADVYNDTPGQYYWSIFGDEPCIVTLNSPGVAGGTFIGYIPADYEGEWDISNESVGWQPHGLPFFGIECKAVLIHSGFTFEVFATLG